MVRAIALADHVFAPTPFSPNFQREQRFMTFGMYVQRVSGTALSQLEAQEPDSGMRLDARRAPTRFTAAPAATDAR